MEQFTCSVCGRRLPEHNFYKKRDGKIYPVCKSDFCKIYIDQNNIDEACKLLDIPQINQEIYYVVKKAKEDYDGNYFSGVCWFGKYVSKMKLKAFQQFTYQDSQWLNEVREEKTNKTTPIGIRGIVWYKKFNTGSRKFDELIDQYAAKSICVEYLTRRGFTEEVKFENGDIWYLFSTAHFEHAKGRRVNISYVDRAIDKKIVDNVIDNITTAPPYNAIRFYD